MSSDLNERRKIVHRAIYQKCLSEVPSEYLPNLLEGRRLRNEWWTNSASSKSDWTIEEKKLVKSYDEFTAYVSSAVTKKMEEEEE